MIIEHQAKYRTEIETELKDLIKQEKTLTVEIDRLVNKLSKEELTQSLNEIVIANMKSKSQELDSIKACKANLSKEIAMLDKDVKLDSLQVKSDLANFEELQSELTEEEKTAAVQLVIKKAVLKSLKNDGAKRYFSLQIEPTDSYKDKIGVLNIEFYINNSTGKGVWAITSPFVLESKNQVQNTNQRIKDKKKRVK